MDDLPIETIASVNLASPIALSILWERGPSRERSLATVAPYLRITVHPEVPQKAYVRIGDDTPGTRTTGRPGLETYIALLATFDVLRWDSRTSPAECRSSKFDLRLRSYSRPHWQQCKDSTGNEGECTSHH